MFFQAFFRNLYIIKIQYILTSTIEITDLKISFPNSQGNTLVVQDLNLKIPQGKTMGLVGESGSGKSVTSLAIMQLLSKNAIINAGTISLHLKDNKKTNLLSINENVLQKLRGNRISMIFQEPMTALNPVIKCGKQVEEIIKIHQSISTKELTVKVLGLLKSVKLPQVNRIYKSYPHELSGGQKQRLMIAMAMANEPELLIADEPTTALDVSVQKTILELLKELQLQFKTSILFITHDLGVVAEIADEIAIMYKGEIVETGEVEHVLSQPKHKYTKALLACRPPLDSRPYRLPTISHFLNNEEYSDIPYITSKERKAVHEEIYKSSPVLSVDDLVVAFDTKKNILGKTIETFQAVKGVSFDLFKGETLGLVGESGCGKTSLSRALLGLQKAKAGNIWWQGEDILQYSTKQWRLFRQKVQIIFQDPYGSLNPVLTVGKAIMEPLLVHQKMNKQEAKKQTLELLNKTGMPAEAFNKLPSEFSGGQRQRISIARALAMKPEIIICDESVSALDVSVQAQILNLLNQLKDEYKLSYLFISHDLSVVKYMSDRVMVMKEGEIIETQEADILFEHPQNDYTQMLISSIPGVG